MSSLLCLLIVLAVSAPRLQAYTFSEYLNTDSGYCEGETYGRIPVGQDGFDDIRCERIECGEGVRFVAGFVNPCCKMENHKNLGPFRVFYCRTRCGKVLQPDDSRCRIVQGEGRFPGCCPNIKCDVKIV